MNVVQIQTTVTWMPTARIQRDHSTARVIRDTREMESRVKVRIVLIISINITSGDEFKNSMF